jgi:hypothetical protein
VLQVSLDEATLLPLAPLSATVRVTNAGTAPVELAEPPGQERYDPVFGLRLSVAAEGSAPCLVTIRLNPGCVQNLPRYVMWPGASVVVPFLWSHGEAKELRSSEDGYTWTVERGSGPVVSAPGNCTVRATLIEPGEVSGLRPKWWILESNPVTVTVSAPTGVDKLAYEFVRDNGLVEAFGWDVALQGGEGLHRTVTLLPELLERFPTSTYAKYAATALANLYFRGAALSGEVYPGGGAPNWQLKLYTYYRQKGWAPLGLELPSDATTVLLLERLRDLVNRSDPFFRPGVILLYADALVAKNRKPDAIIALKTLLKESPNSPFAPKAQELLNKISG